MSENHSTLAKMSWYSLSSGRMLEPGAKKCFVHLFQPTPDPQWKRVKKSKTPKHT